MTLVIMAAGMGSRFGGLKQIEPVGPSGEFIIDYSIYDAIKAGFTKVVFIIKEENYEIFKSTIGSRIENKIDVEYVFQKNDNVSKDIEIPKDRVKPLGTAHAILCIKGVVNEPFTIINADDFYGRDAYKKAFDFFNADTNDYAMIAYKVGNTLTNNGSVKRGYCKSSNGYLTNIIESSMIEENGKVRILDYLEKDFNVFLKNNKDSLDTCEYLIPDVVFKRIKDKEIKVRVVDTKAVWHGVTYKEDKKELQDAINKLIENSEYPYNLYE